MTIDKMNKIKKERGYSNLEIAQLSGVPFSTVNKVLGGFTKSPRRETLEAIEKVLLKENVVIKNYPVLESSDPILIENSVFWDEEKIISKELLDKFSYRSNLPQNLNQLSLRSTPLEDILYDIEMYREEVFGLSNVDESLDFRFKSKEAIIQKYKNSALQNLLFRQLFNDVLSFRFTLSEYPKEFPYYYKVKDLRSGREASYGYRAIHLYYQRDGFSYPIEIQLWAGRDIEFNTWNQELVYKYYDPSVGIALRKMYDNGEIKTKVDFQRMLKRIVNA